MIIGIFGCAANESSVVENGVFNFRNGKQTPFEEIQSGDIIFQTSLSNQSKAIQIATKSKYSHMGLIYQKGNRFYVYEAVQPVKLTPLLQWIKRGENGHFVIKRLKNSAQILTQKNLAKMKVAGEKYLSKSYDSKFQWSDDKMYCSELVWKIYKEVFDIEIGKLEKIKDFDLSDKRVEKKVKERYGNRLPLDELVITPDRMFNSNLLKTVVIN